MSSSLIVLALSGAAAFSPALAPAARPALVRGPVAVHAATLPRVANLPVMDAAKLPRANPPVMEEAASDVRLRRGEPEACPDDSLPAQARGMPKEAPVLPAGWRARRPAARSPDSGIASRGRVCSNLSAPRGRRTRLPAFKSGSYRALCRLR